MCGLEESEEIKSFTHTCKRACDGISECVAVADVDGYIHGFVETSYAPTLILRRLSTL